MNEQRVRLGRSGQDHGKFCPEQEDLIDLVDGELPPERARAIETHLVTCQACRLHVDSVRRALGVAAGDIVPEPAEGYWACFESVARRRAGEGGVPWGRGRLVAVLASGLAVLVAVVFLMMHSRARFHGLGDAEVALERPGTDAGVVATVSPADSLLADLCAQASEDKIASIETYLTEDGDIYDMINSLTPDEKQSLVSKLSDILKLKS